jgi:hypothetical protein
MAAKFIYIMDSVEDYARRWTNAEKEELDFFTVVLRRATRKRQTNTT